MVNVEPELAGPVQPRLEHRIGLAEQCERVVPQLPAIFERPPWLKAVIDQALHALRRAIHSVPDADRTCTSEARSVGEQAIGLTCEHSTE